MRASAKSYCLRQGTSTVSQSVRQAGKQSFRQSVGQAGRQTGRQKHVSVFQLRTTITNIGEPLVHRNTQWSSPKRRPSRSTPEPFLTSTLVQILLTTNFRPPPPPPKKWYPVSGGYRPQNQKIHWGIFLSNKLMILQGVGHRSHALGYATRMTPQKGGAVWHSRLRLI